MTVYQRGWPLCGSRRVLVFPLFAGQSASDVPSNCNKDYLMAYITLARTWKKKPNSNLRCRRQIITKSSEHSDILVLSNQMPPKGSTSAAVDLGPNLLKLTRFDPQVMKLPTWRLSYSNYRKIARAPGNEKRTSFAKFSSLKGMRMSASVCRPGEPSKFTVEENFQTIIVHIAYISYIASNKRTDMTAAKAGSFSAKQK